MNTNVRSDTNTLFFYFHLSLDTKQQQQQQKWHKKYHLMISDHKKGKYSAANLLGNKFMEFLVIENFCDVPFIIGVDCVLYAGVHSWSYMG